MNSATLYRYSTSTGLKYGKRQWLGKRSRDRCPVRWTNHVENETNRTLDQLNRNSEDLIKSRQPVKRDRSPRSTMKNEADDGDASLAFLP